MIGPPEKRAAWRILRGELGLASALRIGLAVEVAHRRGEPFAALGPPADDRERLSRAQIGPAILLYRALRRRLGPERALTLAERVIVEGAIHFLRATIGPLRRADLEALDDDARDAWVRARGERFFNATVRWDEIRGDRVAFTVERCRFPPLCHAAGVPELAPLFCRGDARFFGEVEPAVRLERPQTIAAGAPTCVFRLRWTEAD